MARRDWTKKQIHDAAERLRSGARPVALAADLDRTREALELAVVRAGYVWRLLLQAGRLARVRIILGEGGDWPEVMASESVKRDMAVRLVSQALDKGDRRRLKRRHTQADERRIYLLVREHGIRGASQILSKPFTTVRRIAFRYRAEVLPGSPPFEPGPCRRRVQGSRERLPDPVPSNPSPRRDLCDPS
jgi:hypothetical protein